MYKTMITTDRLWIHWWTRWSGTHSRLKI